MDIQQGQRYRHYRGNTYVVLALAHHSETGELMVVYQGEYDDPEFGSKPIWVRPHAMFIETVEVGNEQKKRFELIA